VSVKQSILLSLAVLVLFTFLLVIVFGDQGVADLKMMQVEQKRLVERNKRLLMENQALYRNVDRLENDLEFIENVARQELGMIGEDELVFKMKKSGKTNND
jgi:cell division protein FtsB